jgi:hypothetical protein
MMPPMAAQARTIVTGGEPAAWVRLGFALQEDGSACVGGLRLVPGGDELRVEAVGLAEERPDGLAITATTAPECGAAKHPNGALAVDHLVAFTDDLDRTCAALERSGAPLRRRAEPRPGTPMAFHRLGPLVLELVGGGERPAFWGLVVVVADLDACARELRSPPTPLVGEVRDAVQPGRRIATVRPEAGLPVALALMTPQPRPANAVGE